MRNLNKSNVLTTIESINRTLKKNVEKIILKIWVHYVSRSIKVGSFFCSVIQGLKEKRQTVKLVKFNIFCKKQAQNNATETSDQTVPTT